MRTIEHLEGIETLVARGRALRNEMMCVAGARVLAALARGIGSLAVRRRAKRCGCRQEPGHM